jgi:hypothetical protein
VTGTRRELERGSSRFFDLTLTAVHVLHFQSERSSLLALFERFLDFTRRDPNQSG